MKSLNTQHDFQFQFRVFIRSLASHPRRSTRRPQHGREPAAVAVRGRSQWSEALHHWNTVTRSTSPPRSASSSSMARYDSRYRRYRRLAIMITTGGKRNRATPDSYSTCPSAVRERSSARQTTYVSLRSNTSWVRHRGIDDRRRGLVPLGHLCSMVPSCFWGGRALASCQSSLGFVPELAAPACASSSCCRVLTRLPQSCLWSFRSRWVRSF